MTGFYNGTQTFFLNRGETSGNIAGGRLTASHILSDRFGPLFHLRDDLVDFFPHRSIRSAYRPAGQDILTSQELGGFSKYYSGTQIYQLVRYIADHAVGGHAGGGI